MDTRRMNKDHSRANMATHQCCNQTICCRVAWYIYIYIYIYWYMCCSNICSCNNMQISLRHWSYAINKCYLCCDIYCSLVNSNFMMISCLQLLQGFYCNSANPHGIHSVYTYWIPRALSFVCMCVCSLVCACACTLTIVCMILQCPSVYQSL